MPQLDQKKSTFFAWTLVSKKIQLRCRWKCGNPTWRKSCWKSRLLSWMEKNSTSWTLQPRVPAWRKPAEAEAKYFENDFKRKKFLGTTNIFGVFCCCFDVVLCSWVFGDWFWMLLSWSITFALPLTCKSSSRYAELLKEREQAVLFVSFCSCCMFFVRQQTQRIHHSCTHFQTIYKVSFVFSGTFASFIHINIYIYIYIRIPKSYPNLIPIWIIWSANWT